MSNIIYTRRLLESWANILRNPINGVNSNKKARLEASGDDLDVTQEMGDFGSIRDYDNEEQMGYNEGDDDDADRMYTERLGMHEEDVAGDADAEIKKEKKEKKARKARKAAEEAPVPETKTQAAYKARREADARALASKVADELRVVADSYPREGLPENIAGLVDGIYRTGRVASSVEDIQYLIHQAELLGIEAAKAGCVPQGIPERPVEVQDVIGLVYLTIPDGYWRIYNYDPDSMVKIFSPEEVARKTRFINANITGKGTTGEPVIPELGETASPLYKSLFREAARGKDFVAAGKKQSAAQAPASSMPSDFTSVEPQYAGSLFNGTQKYAVPHNLFSAAVDIANGNIKTSRGKVGIAHIKDMMGGDAKTVASTMLVLGYRDFCAKYSCQASKPMGVERSCFMTIPAGPESNFSASQRCIAVTSDMVSDMESALCGARNTAVLIDAEGNEVSGIKVEGKEEPICDFFPALKADLQAASAKGTGKTKIANFACPRLYALIDGNYMLKKNPRRMVVDGTLKLVNPEPEHLFDFIDIGGNSVKSMDTSVTIGGSNGDDEVATGEHERLSSADTHMDLTQSGNTVLGTLDAVVDSRLKQQYSRGLFRKMGFDSVPTPNDDARTKLDFFVNVMLRASGIMAEYGSLSTIERGNAGCPIVANVDESAKELYGRDADIITVWKKEAEDSGEAGVLDGSWQILKDIYRWLNTVQNYDMTVSDVIAGLTGDAESFNHTKRVLTPYIEMVPMLMYVARSNMMKDGCASVTPETLYRFAVGYIAKAQREANVDILSPKSIENAIRYVRDSYGDNEALLTEATSEPPYHDNSALLEWCVVRFLMSGQGEGGKLVPPEKVGSEPVAEDRIDERLKNYRKIMAAKPAYLKRDAWLARNSINPAEYDMLERKAAGGVRIVTMGALEISRWLSGTYVSHGDRGEVTLLLLGLLSIATRVMDKDHADTRFGRQDMADTISLSETVMSRMLSLTDAIAECGADKIVGILGTACARMDSVQALMNIISSTEPMELGEVGELLGDEAGTDIRERLAEVLDDVSGIPFLIFNGLSC